MLKIFPKSNLIPVITGFNTDIKYKGTTYHVQTEDKGTKTPLILSLVYHGGTILASKRSSYDDLMTKGFDEKILAERLDRQHKLICAAIKSGRIEDLKRMTMKNSSAPKEGLVVKKESKKRKPKPKIEKVKDSINKKTNPKVKESVPKKHINEVVELSDEEMDLLKKVEDSDDEKVWDTIIIDDVTIVEEDESFEEELVLSSDAVKILDDFTTADEVGNNELKIKFLKNYRFKSGQEKKIDVLICRGNKENTIQNANLTLKIIGTSFRPMIFHSKTNDQGIARISFKIPNFISGRAAILVRAIVEGEEAELRKIISYK